MTRIGGNQTRRWLTPQVPPANALHLEPMLAPQSLDALLVDPLLSAHESANATIAVARVSLHQLLDCGEQWVVITTDHRVIPLSGRLLPYGGTGADIQIELLRDLPPMLPSPKQVRITFFSDAEFRAVDVQRWCQAQGWHWQVGVKRDTWFRDEHGVWQQLRDIPIQRGERVYHQQIWLTQEHEFGPVNLMVDWISQEDTPRCIILDQPADRRAWRRGRKRYWIESTLRDLKSAGFDLEQTELENRERVERMVLAMLLTFVWMLFISQQLIASGQRTLLSACHKRDYSRFRMGRDWLRCCLALGKPIPVGFIVGQ
ncbi:MAG: transposase [Chloroflexales bacterium]